jgi:hypothetical protein
MYIGGFRGQKTKGVEDKNDGFTRIGELLLTPDVF